MALGTHHAEMILCWVHAGYGVEAITALLAANSGRVADCVQVGAECVCVCKWVQVGAE
jgi:hypothetical protein